MPLPTFLPLLAVVGLLTPTPPPESSLTLSIGPYEGAAAERTVSLTCDPDEGTHPTPALACQDLVKAGGDITKVGDPHTACTDHLEDPKIGIARGRWQGRVVDQQVVFGNPCEFATRSGYVFKVHGK
ncbi:hypothetical protein JOF53_003363 [Crossiella equi]|uniref:Subtilisin inhibitor domain-containing protein n=1 Tax=Crossiella equi TaxID=130796 RepID=A0ABS5AD41_9PSEU|nr:SSI family serine proteinase inhibitor [Crossiella equi]MBP2474491.1 hypothetical protein [Crossiella equi]